MDATQPKRTVVTRTLFPGGSVVPEYVVKSVSLTPLRRLRATRVRTLGEYEAGCAEHKDCFGHVCETPRGIKLVPQSLSMVKGETANDYLKAARMAFSGDRAGYEGLLRSVNMKKTGHMRKDILGTPISGSMRLIIVPQVQLPRGTIAVPRNIARLLRTPTRGRDTATGRPTDRVEERCMRDGDWAIMVRPPSLTLYSAQPVRVRLWDVQTLGVSPDDVGFWHGDFDGDEMHVYPVYEADSVDECQRWQRGGNDAFTRASKRLDEAGFVHSCAVNLFPFIQMTNVTMEHIKALGKHPAFAKESRMKAEHLAATGRRFTDDPEAHYTAESIRGMSDVARQQLTQGSIGYMSRLAKIAAMCFFRKGSRLFVQASSGLVLLGEGPTESYGCPCLRAVSGLCSVAQQAALDSHRAGADSMPSYDMISNLFRGDSDTVVQLRHDSPMLRASGWRARVPRGTFRIVTRSMLSEHGGSSVVASYSPWVLSRTTDAFDVCMRGLNMVCTYFSVRLTEDELHDMCHMMTFNVGASSAPITCSMGLSLRGVGWIDELMATSYSRLKDVCGDGTLPEEPRSGTCALFTGNFRLVNG